MWVHWIILTTHYKVGRHHHPCFADKDFVVSTSGESPPQLPLLISVAAAAQTGPCELRLSLKGQHPAQAPAVLTSHFLLSQDPLLDPHASRARRWELFPWGKPLSTGKGWSPRGKDSRPLTGTFSRKDYILQGELSSIQLPPKTLMCRSDFSDTSSMSFLLLSLSSRLIPTSEQDTHQQPSPWLGLCFRGPQTMRHRRPQKEKWQARGHMSQFFWFLIQGLSFTFCFHLYWQSNKL